LFYSHIFLFNKWYLERNNEIYIVIRVVNLIIHQMNELKKLLQQKPSHMCCLLLGIDFMTRIHYGHWTTWWHVFRLC